MIQQITNFRLIKQIMIDDTELYDRIRDDHFKLENWTPDKVLYLGYFDDDLKAILSVHAVNAICLEVHINIPKKHRGENSLKIGKSFIQYLIENADKRIVRIQAQIPVIFPDVKRFAEKVGFEVEGTMKKAIIKNGDYHDVNILGLIIR